MTDERRIGMGELVRIVDRIDGRTARMEAAMFEEHGLITRIVVLEGQAEEDRNERNLHRAWVAIATLVGSSIGAVTAYLGGHH